MIRNLINRIKWAKLNRKFTALVIGVVLFPIGLLAGIIYYNMEQNVISENISYMQYTMERNKTQIEVNIDAIRMATQLVLSNDAILDVLNRAYRYEKMSTEELMEFRDREVATIERLVNNTPLLNSVRVYSTTDNVQETMPVLYGKSRMNNLEWAHSANRDGWHYGYLDTTFSSLLTAQNTQLMSLITPIEDYQNGEVGVIETAMEMRTMFPSMYEEVDNEWSCFVYEDGTVYYGENEEEADALLLGRIEEQVNGLETDTINTYYQKDNGGKYVISYLYDEHLHGTLVSVRDITDSVNAIYKSRNTFIMVAILLLIFLTFLVNGIVNRMLKVFYEILVSIRQVQDGNLSIRIDDHGEDEMGELAAQLNKMLDRIQVLMDDNIAREILVKDTEIRALQNQINAHFIYNVLETIKMMAEIDEEYLISDAITALGKLLRYSMKWVSNNVHVSEELEYIKNYVTLINLRFDYEIILSVNIPEELMDQEIPKMSLQPIVENAILHGIEEVAEDTTIYIKGYVKGDDCIIEITDSGKGMTEAQVESLRQKIAGKIETEGGSGNGIGLKNVQDRITIAFGPEYGLDIASKIDCYTKIIVHLPHVIGARNLPVTK